MLIASALERAISRLFRPLANFLRASHRFLPLFARPFEGALAQLLRALELTLPLLSRPLELTFAQLGLLLADALLLMAHLVVYAILLLSHPGLLFANPVALHLGTDLRFLLVHPSISINDLCAERSGESCRSDDRENSETIDPDHDILLGVVPCRRSDNPRAEKRSIGGSRTTARYSAFRQTHRSSSRKHEG